MFIVSRPSAEIELGIQGLLIVVGKLEIHALEKWNMIGHELFHIEPIGNIFYLQAAIFEIPK